MKDLCQKWQVKLIFQGAWIFLASAYDTWTDLYAKKIDNILTSADLDMGQSHQYRQMGLLGTVGLLGTKEGGLRMC